jgi:hypothetical protein
MFAWKAPTHEGEEIGDTELAQSLEVLADCRQRRGIKAREGRVVEADDADLSRDSVPSLQYRVHGT